MPRGLRQGSKNYSCPDWKISCTYGAGYRRTNTVRRAGFDLQQRLTQVGDSKYHGLTMRGILDLRYEGPC